MSRQALTTALIALAMIFTIGSTAFASGTIKGTVKFDGQQKDRKPIRMKADKFCDEAHPDAPVLNELYVFGENNTLQNVFVHISKGLKGNDFKPADKQVIDQQGCVYHPHVVGVMVGQEIEILNSDSTLHNVKATAKKNSSFNEGMPVKGMKINKKMDKPEMQIELKCDVHAWMKAYLHVMEHPFFDTSDGKGQFEIKNVPAGTYELSTWHELPPFKPTQKTYTVEVKDGETATVEITYSPPKKK